MDYIIFTDSCADLTAEFIESSGIYVAPLEYIIGGKQYLDIRGDDNNIDMKTFYDRMRAGENTSTSQITSEAFKEVFIQLYERHKLPLLYVAFSSGLSGTYESSEIAIRELADERPEISVTSVDTLSGSFGQGMLVKYALELQARGYTLEQNRDWLLSHRQKLIHWVTVEDLKYLYRGGRVSRATAFLGTMLSIKPILQITDDGRLVAAGKAKGRKQSLKMLADKMQYDYDGSEFQNVGIIHGDSEADARLLGAMVTEKMGITDIEYVQIGPVIGSHSGPGTIGLLYLGKNR